MKTRQLSLSAVLIAMALGLSYMERFIPLGLVVPLPGVKLGLANIITMFALYTMTFRNAAAILAVRCIMGSFFGGGITALAFSLTGGFLALTVMALVKKLPFLSVYGVSILGAAGHNVGQILAAMATLKSVYVISYLPLLLVTGLACGTLTGIMTVGTLKALAASKQMNAAVGRERHA